MGRYTIRLRDVGSTAIAEVGGKAASLGEVARIAGVRVPDGFCVTTEAFGEVVARTPAIDRMLESAARLEVSDPSGIAAWSGEIRNAVEGATVPDDVAEAISAQVGEGRAHAVRSSATAEDLPFASFAGQLDTYLNVAGAAAVLHHVRRCWASLFTARAVTYRLEKGIDQRRLRMAVVVQEMVHARASGVMFTADPISFDRTIVSIDATFGLGEALVSGLVNPDNYRVRDGSLAARSVAAKHLEVVADAAGGTTHRPIAPGGRAAPALDDAHVLELAQLGRRIEAHFGAPQDIEWCLDARGFSIVQSRPITTLFPVPRLDDGKKHLYLSVGHQQMMTDALKPLGLSMFQLTAFGTMHAAGGRLFVDASPALATSAGREGLLKTMAEHDPLTEDAVRAVLDRGDFGAPSPAPEGAPAAPPLPEANVAVVRALQAESCAAIEAAEQALRGQSGAALFDGIEDDVARLKAMVFGPRSMAVLRAATQAAAWLDEHLRAWLGEENVSYPLSQAVPDNVTAQMGLALLDVADALRPYPAVLAHVQQATDADLLDGLRGLEGGAVAHAALVAYLDAYGMRCTGEIDITRPRWREAPTALVPALLANVRGFEPGEAARKLEKGRREAEALARSLLERIERLPDGAVKAREAALRIDQLRTLTGYREHPKYAIVGRYFVYRKALLAEADRLVERGIVHQREDVYFLTFQELRETSRSGTLDRRIIETRRLEHAHHQKLSPPRVLTSDGEVPVGRYRRTDLPADALVGLGVSPGVVEGRARVVLRLEDAQLAEGDILVTTFTDPGWTPLFGCIRGLVTEIGGRMTHGAVIAREYGLPAIVGVANATQRIEDGRRIRVHGTHGYVELL